VGGAGEPDGGHSWGEAMVAEVSVGREGNEGEWRDGEPSWRIYRTVEACKLA